MRSPFEPEWLATVFDSLGDVVYCVKDTDGVYQSVNQAFVDRVDAGDKSDVIGRTAFDFFPRELAQSYTDQDQYVLEHGQSIQDQLEQISNSDGSLGWYLASKFPFLDPDTQQVSGLIGISQDLHSPSDQHVEMSNLKSVVEFIKTNLDQPMTTEALAATVGLSGDQLDRRMKRVFRLSTKKFIMKSRLEKASRLLTHTGNSLADIAAVCGFTDQSAFTRQFRAAAQATPSQYRKQNR